jgi:hypothetical protein
VKVRVGSKYVFNPVPLDRIDSRSKATLGEVVRVINLPGAPKANTMGHCHIESLSGTFLGMVLTNSLLPVPKGYKNAPR